MTRFCRNVLNQSSPVYSSSIRLASGGYENIEFDKVNRMISVKGRIILA